MMRLRCPLAFALLAISGLSLAAERIDDPKAVYLVPVDDTPLRGPAEAPVTIVEFSDMECPYCKRAAPTLKQIEEAYRGKVRFAFKHNPLSMHRFAGPAAMVAEAARAKGGDAAFWKVTDALMAAQPLDEAAINKAGQEAGLDPASLKANNPEKLIEKLRRDQMLAFSLGATGTPGFFINGRKLMGAHPFESFKAVIDEELVKAEALVKSGVAPRDVYARTIRKGATAPVLVDAPAAPAAATAQAAGKVPVRADDALKGPALAPITLVVFSDFQCPFCGKVEPTLAELEKAYPGKIRVAWRHLPLPFHPNALPAAKVSEAARLQGKFWPMHDKLFSDQQALSTASYSNYAKELDLDLGRFGKDLESVPVAARIADDQELAGKLGATGTPAIFVNCRLVSGAQPFEAFKTVVEEELKKAGGLLAKGEKLDAGFYDRLCAANVAAAPPVVAAAPPAPRTGVKVALRPDDPSRGPDDARVTVVEFSDFQCPFCSRALPVLKEIEQANGKEVRVVWKHLPLPFHPNAMPAALAAEAARAQGKFWEMHDKLFANQQALSEASYAQFAKELGLDLARFEAARKAPETRKRVDEDLAAATTAGVNGTPTFVVNGEVVVGSVALRDALDRQLKRAKLAAAR
jgi:protein-disulfide isomerase